MRTGKNEYSNENCNNKLCFIVWFSCSAKYVSGKRSCDYRDPGIPCREPRIVFEGEKGDAQIDALLSGGIDGAD
jgi:hypothetical protein